MEDTSALATSGPVTTVPAVHDKHLDDAITTTPSEAEQLDNSPGLPAPSQGHHVPMTMNQHAFASQFYMASAPQQDRNSAPYNMANMASALPPASYRGSQYPQGGQQRYNMMASPHMMQHMPQIHPQYGGPQQISILGAGQSYYAQQAPMPQFYNNNTMASGQNQGIPGGRPMAFLPNQMGMNHIDPQYFYGQPGQFSGQAGSMPVNTIHGQYVPSSPVGGDARTVSQSQETTGGSGLRLNNRGQDEPESRQGAVRGPPRKPRQSGHAIWIGNLPPQTDLMNLVHHVCREAPGLVSLFLISKSNCAFANFKDEPTCVAAQQSLHDSRFQGIRLVSRLRKSTVEGAQGVTAPTGPAATSPISARNNEAGPDEIGEDAASPTSVTSPSIHAKAGSAGERQQDKFFILKSLTVQDLELSVRNNIWATQSHNENALNDAFKDADNVYLVFSANKSGEYFGYARMTSQIDDDPDKAIEVAPKSQAVSELDLPKAIPTEATEHTPRGKIMDDSARGSIFWEAERDESDQVSDSGSEDGDIKPDEEGKVWGKPFQLEWLSTTKLPFYRTRGLRNPWNSNREVKIARDGTELEPSVGRRLIGLFNRVQSPVSHMHGGLRSPIGPMGGFPLNRPYGNP